MLAGSLLCSPETIPTLFTSYTPAQNCSCCSAAKLCPTLYGPMDCSTLGSPALHHLPELAQNHGHWVRDAIQPSHPLSSPSPPAFSLSQHQGLFQWVSSLHQEARVLELQPQHQSLQFRVISFRMDWLDLLAIQGVKKKQNKTHTCKCEADYARRYAHTWKGACPA